MFPKYSLRVLVPLLAMTLTVLPSPAFADDFGSGENQFTIDFVPISADTNPTEAQTTAGDLHGFGIVEYDYRIGVYEITQDQWSKFEAQAGTPTGNPREAYDEPFYDYGTGTTLVPTNNVSWCEAAQFVNWLNTSTGHHAAYNFADGDFTNWGAADAWRGTNLYRHKDAFYFLPDEDEWFKAAYWNGTDIQNYATKPGETLHQDDGSGTGWNYYVRRSSFNREGPWDVGSGSEELNGTYDMMGNASEWMESPYRGSGYYGTGSPPALRGGNWDCFSISLRATNRWYDAPSRESSGIGFRVASIPEPGSITLLVCGVLAGLLRPRYGGRYDVR